MVCRHGGEGARSCRPSLPRPSEDNARFGLLAALILFYLLCGAAVFSALARDSELQAHRHWDEQLANFSRRHGVGPQALQGLLRHYEDAYGAGVRADPVSPRWDFLGAFYFTGSVIATIGFGMTTPATAGGKIFLIFYGLIGCAATLLLLNLFLERLIALLAQALLWCHQRQSRCLGGTAGGAEEGRPEGWKPSVYSVMLILGVTALLIATGASLLLSSMEGWGYLESFYFCFVAFSTIGFGDLVSSQGEGHWAHGAYRLGNSLIIFAGVCCLYSLYSVTSILIKQLLKWVLSKLSDQRCHPCPSPSPFWLCCCPPRFPGNPPPVGSCCCDQHCGCNVVNPAPSPTAPGVETVYNSEMDIGGGRRLSGEMISVKDFLASNKVSLVAMQKQLSEISPVGPQEMHSQHTGFSGGAGSIAVMNNRLQETITNM
ncbi:hypothetical protein AAFF_G00195580 [Aldrovandia affinis]|uniref:Potassium channel domain-containing protein n=1 Tax=Aldrovandia affinis TaxID=143900 RepID=A0AAD7RIL7_9TELE|nr:hypothetical protein AAFF_G00195580 [Aldrovandia affinis]